MKRVKFTNSYSKLPERFFQRVHPKSGRTGKLIAFNNELAKEMGLSDYSEHDQFEIFSGNKIPSYFDPIAMAYAGFQFGNPVPQLGDGRAHLLGEINGFDIQLKGSGSTKFSRGGDGNSALGPVIREYLISEAMHALGIPTTRALAAVQLDEKVYRQYGEEPAGIFTRVAKSHIRVGTFQYFAFKEDYEAIKVLLDYTLERHYPEISIQSSLNEKVLLFLKELSLRQADLIAKWSSFGFIHGVMNTDNFSVVPLTIDYGPCAFMDEFKFNKVFSSIDRNARYSFFNQVKIAKWNILRLAEVFIPFMDGEQSVNIKKVEETFVSVFKQFEIKRMEAFGKKLGIEKLEGHDEKNIMNFLTYLETHSLDFTLAFRNLDQLYNDDFEFFTKGDEIIEFQSWWKTRVSDISNLNNINPIYIPRNHLIQKVIDEAYEGKYDLFNKMNLVLKNPFIEKDEYSDFSLAPKPSERVYQTFCGT